MLGKLRSAAFCPTSELLSVKICSPQTNEGCNPMGAFLEVRPVEFSKWMYKGSSQVALVAIGSDTANVKNSTATYNIAIQNLLFVLIWTGAYCARDAINLPVKQVILWNPPMPRGTSTKGPQSLFIFVVELIPPAQDFVTFAQRETPVPFDHTMCPLSQLSGQ